MPPTSLPSSRILELRQYTLKPGCRETLVDVFDRFLVDGQEQVGMEVVGQFRDLDDSDRFVWLRGFASMDMHAEALGAFYYGPVWKAHAAVANATMIDSDNVMLLEPLDGGDVPLRRSASTDEAVLSIDVAFLDGQVSAADRSLAERGSDAMLAAGAELLAVLTTHEAENDFPALPIRDEHVLVWVSRFANDRGLEACRSRLQESTEWQTVLAGLARRGNGLAMQRLRLQPTDGSRLR